MHNRATLKTKPWFWSPAFKASTCEYLCEYKTFSTYSDPKLFRSLCDVISAKSVVNSKHIIPPNKSGLEHVGLCPENHRHFV